MTAPHCNEAETLPDNLTVRAADVQADALRLTQQTLEACADTCSDDPPPAVECFKRLILAAHAYLELGRKLADARGECQPDQWGTFLAACTIDAKTAEDMMSRARVGLTAWPEFRSFISPALWRDAERRARELDPDR